MARAHVRFGWTTLVVFVAIGLALEALHGFKVGWYLDASAENRRLLLTLGHAHGTLLSLINLGFAATCHHLAEGWPRRAGSVGLRAATIVLPGGFLLGGAWLVGTDPALTVLLVPLGGLLLLAAVTAAAVAAWRR